MLSLSADLSNQDVNLDIINGDGDGGVLYGAELAQFAEALASRDETQLGAARERLLKVAGEQVLVDAAAVAANFQRMVRIADSTGIPVDGMMGVISEGIPEQLGLRRFHSSQNTPQANTLKRLINLPLRLLASTILRKADKKMHRQRS